jgi:hypothetical protein
MLHWDAVWFADDHLLTVRSLANSDTYRRFFLRDIEAVVIRRTRSRLWVNLALLVFAGLGLLPLFFLLSPFEPDRAFAGLAVVAVAPLALVVINTVRGPTCEVRIQTPVQTERVAALSRLRTARATLGRLRPLIWQAQQAELAARTAAAGHPGDDVPGGPPPGSAPS